MNKVQEPRQGLSWKRASKKWYLAARTELKGSRRLRDAFIDVTCEKVVLARRVLALEAALREAVNRIGSDWDSCSCDNVDGVCGFCRFQEEVTALLAGRVEGERKER